MTDEAAARLRHDLRTPLTVVSGFARLLAAEGPVPEEQRRDYARRIEAACSEMERMVDEFGRA